MFLFGNDEPNPLRTSSEYSLSYTNLSKKRVVNKEPSEEFEDLQRQPSQHSLVDEYNPSKKISAIYKFNDVNNSTQTDGIIVPLIIDNPEEMIKCIDRFSYTMNQEEKKAFFKMIRKTMFPKKIPWYRRLFMREVKIAPFRYEVASITPVVE